MSKEEGKFKVICKTNLKDLREGNTIPESDLTIQTDTDMIQFEYVEGKSEVKKKTIKTGCYSFADTAMGIILEKFKLKEYELLKDVVNTKFITDESNKFFTKVEEGVYEKLGKDPKRALLIASPPGIGKSATINSVCKEYLLKGDIAVLIWDTSAVKAQSINKFFLSRSKFASNVKKMILVMEDIGGGSIEADHSQKAADSSLLNLLDGIGKPFGDVPTFIIATTNNPEQSVAALIDRPGRFDKVQIMKAPSENECSRLLEFICKIEEPKEGEDSESYDLVIKDIKRAAKIAAKDKFSIAHLQEIIVRSMIDDIEFTEAALQLSEHKKKFNKAFKESAGGIGLAGS